ncbi:MAG: hypothetical protein EWM72_00063 [Nitrospira sp.]|nr:MAG: hypothetical protein EWM72_00063 [Nitrospira sp.]
MRGRHFVVASLLVITLLFIHSFVAANFSGTIVRVIDGDTLEVLHNQHRERIRLSGIDCSEKGQAYGKHAKQAASELVFGKEVTLHTFNKDKYRRTIADVSLPDGTNVNQSLVKDGWCWWYRKYAPGDTVLEGLEQVVAWRSQPQAIRHDNGPEFLADRLASWGADRGIALEDIQQGQPNQNVLVTVQSDFSP